MIRAGLVGVLVLSACSDGQKPRAESEGPGHTQVFQARGRVELDVLVVVQDWPGSRPQQDALVGSFADFADDLGEFDYRVAVTTTDPTNGGRFVAPEGCQPIIDETVGAACPTGDGACREAAFNEAFDCLARVGVGGQTPGNGLDAMRRALSCDGPNRDAFAACCGPDGYRLDCQSRDLDFLRPNAILMVLVHAAADDCSGLAGTASVSECVWARDTLTPVEDYYRDLTALKRTPLEQLLFAAVTGHREFTPDGDTIHYVSGQPDPNCAPNDGEWDLDVCCPGGRCLGAPQPSCLFEGGSAFAGHRYLELAEFFGDFNGVGCRLHPFQDPDCIHACSLNNPAAFARLVSLPISQYFCLEQTPSCAAEPCDAADLRVTARCDVLEAEGGDCVSVVEERRLDATELDLREEQWCESGWVVVLDVGLDPGTTLEIGYPVAP